MLGAKCTVHSACSAHALSTGHLAPSTRTEHAALSTQHYLPCYLPLVTLRVLATLLLATTLHAHAQNPPQATVVTGRVVAEATGQPVRRAYVIVHGPDTRTTRVTMSGLEGEFRFEGLPADRYRVGASKRPHLSAAVDATSADVVIALPAGAVVTGVMVDHLGHPAVATDVSISGPALPSPQSVATNHLGEYRFFSLPAGEYTISSVRRKGEQRRVTAGTGTQHQAPTLSLEPPEVTSNSVIPGRTLPPEGNGVIAGVALDAVSSEPLADVVVTNTRSRRSVRTGADGRFQFDGLGAATHHFRVNSPGYSPTSSAEVTLADDARVTDVTVRAGRNGSVSGVVRDEVGDPVVGMTVTVTRRQVSQFMPVLMPRGFRRTDDRGMFQMDNLPPGDYVLCACAGEAFAIDPRLRQLLGPTMPDASGLSRLIDQTVRTLPPTFYPGRTRQSDSQIVTVDIGDDRTAMDITMYGVKPFAITGQMVQSGAPPSQAVQITLIQDGDLPGAVGVSEMQPVQVTPDGRFRFAGVAPGTYSLVVTPTAPQQRGPNGYLPVTVADRDVENLVVTLGDGLTISGQVDFSGGTSRPSADLMAKGRVGLGPLDLSARLIASVGTSGSIGHSTLLDEHGRFNVGGVAPGRYFVAVSIPGTPWRTVERVVSPDADATGNLLTIGEAGAVDVLVIATDAPLATLEGSVELARYEPPGDTRIVLFPIDPDRWLEPQRYSTQFQWTFVDPKHTFKIDDLPAGDYYVVRASTFDFEMSVRFLERWAKTAQRVTLRGGATTTVNVKK